MTRRRRARRDQAIAAGVAVGVACSLAWTRSAAAQVRWDASVLVGATQRLTAGDPAAPRPTPGPSAEVHAHVAVLPMIRVGAYGAFDWSPAPSSPSRRIGAVGLRVKLTPPILPAPWRTWAFLGAGVADAFTPRDAGGDSIGMVELPVGVGVGYKLRGPWELCAELGARAVAAKFRIGAAPAEAVGAELPPLVSDDFLAVSLSVGVSLAP
ncbi:MAG TPA: hypothetical protein VE987_13890 [Polyangiaceae bacterium]|nr:hypothetical protein [Polyangiaceae bacterium]